jgi:gamma-glutamyltranspeptidase/glutathione hydrolase/leukotriene-C4 hydrolase
VTYRYGAVASEHGLCSVVGRDVLKSGGNAVDAAIATALCLGVVNSYASGIGGGGFMMIRSPSGSVEIIDMREVAPKFATKTMFEGNSELSQRSGLSIAVPGELRGLHEAHKRYGKLSWSSLFEPAIHIAQHGFEVNERFATMLKLYEKDLLADDYLKSVFAPNGGRIATLGDVIKMPVLAKTLRHIADEGVDVFYKGVLADSIIRTIKKEKGIMVHEDLKNYQVVIRQPIRTHYRHFQVITTPSPTSGPIVSLILNILDQFPILQQTPSNQVIFFQRLVETFKYGFARRTRLGDPKFVDDEDDDNDVEAYVANITKPSYAYDISQNITTNQTFNWQHYEPIFDINNDHGTMHVSIIDPEGMAVAFTSTINTAFGSQIVTDTGILLNNHMDDFSSPGIINIYNVSPSPANFIVPGKRPLSSTCPIMLEDADGHVRVIIGASGGTHIISGVVQSLVYLVDHSLSPKDAIGFPRLHHQLLPHRLKLEPNFPTRMMNSLAMIGHQIEIIPHNMYLAAVQVVTVERQKDNTTIIRAASDKRKNGDSAGF